MTSPPPPWQRVKELFHDGLQRPAEEWPAFFESIGREDPRLADEVRALLAAHAEASPITADEARVRSSPEEAGRTPRGASDGPGAIIDRFKILQVLGEGGFGTVYMAEQLEPVQRRVAFKILKAGMDTHQVIARFEAERQALALMNHENIARVYDAGCTVTGRPYFAMELVRGIPITEHCDRWKLPVAQRLHLFESVCTAIQHAHQKGIIHRDIKPNNVLVASIDGVAIPKVIDFGIAKALDHRLTQKTLFTDFRQMLGTPDYMSPEQAEMGGVDVDTRADIYSLGVLLYELLTGTRPLELRAAMNEGISAVLKQIRESEPQRPSVRLASLPRETLDAIARNRGRDARRLIASVRGDLDWITLRALAKDRTRRYETVNGLMMDVRRHLADEPVLAGPETLVYRASKVFRKHRAAVLTSSAILLTLVTALTISLALFHRALENENAARAHADEAEKSRERAERAERDVLSALEAERTARREATGHRLSAQAMLLAQEDPTTALQLAIEGARLAPGEEADDALYAALANHRLLAVMDGHDARCRQLALSLDGQRAISADDTFLVIVWDLRRRSVEWRFDEHADEITSLGFVPDGRTAFTSSLDGTVRLWDVRTGTIAGVLEHAAPVRFARPGARGERIVTVDGGGRVRIWNLTTTAGSTPLFELESEPVAYDMSSEGRCLAVLDRDMVVHILDLERGTRQARFELSPRDPPPFYNVALWYHPSLQLDAGGERVLVRTRAGQASLHATRDGTAICGYTEPDQFCGPVRLSPDGRFVYVLRRVLQDREPPRGEILFASDGRVLSRLQGDEIGIRSHGVFSRDGRTLLTIDPPRGTFWNVGTGLACGRIHADPHDIYAPCFLLDDETVLTASHAGELHLWARSAYPERRAIVMPTDEGTLPRMAAISPTGERALRWSPAADTKRGPIEIVDTGSGRPLATLARNAREGDHTRFSDDGRRVVICEAAREGFTVFDVTTLKAIFTWNGGGCMLPRFDPSGRHLTVRVGTSTVVFDLQQKRETGRVPASGWQGACLTSDGRLLANIDGAAGTVSVWNVADGTIAGLIEHAAFTFDACFTGDGRYLVTFANDTSVRICRVADLQEVALIAAPTGDYGFLTVNAEGTRVVVNTLDEIDLFELPTGRRLARWRSERRFGEVWFTPGADTLTVASRFEPLRFVPLVPLDSAIARAPSPPSAHLMERFDLGDAESRKQRAREERETIVSARRWASVALVALQDARLGDAFQALERAARTRKRPPMRYHFARACAHALRSTLAGESPAGIASRDADRDVAVEALRALVDAGFRDPRVLEAAPLLLCLHDHAGFQELVSSLR